MKNKMIKNDNTIFIDVDDTLILYPEPNIDSKILKEDGYKQFKYITGEKFLAKPSLKHIRLLKLYNARKFHIVVWSGNGYKHAYNILKQLDLLKYADNIMTKPTRYVDDVSCEKWMGTRIYLEKGEKI